MASSASPKPPADTVILGAGIIGTSTAYYLSDVQDATSRIHLVEASPQLFASASGYAGGFLAKDWFSQPVAQLGALSFALHKELAEQHCGRDRWGYSPSIGISASDGGARGAGTVSGHDWMINGGSRAQISNKRHDFWGAGEERDERPKWLARREGMDVEIISAGHSTAQVDPKRLCHFLLDRSLNRGVKLHQPAKAISVSLDERGVLSGLRVAKESTGEVEIPCSRIILTSGAWTPQIFSKLFPSSKTTLPVSALGGHSLVVRSPRWAAEHESGGCHAVFATDQGGFSPEIFSRIGSEIYVAGLNDATLQLPAEASDAKPDPKEIEKLKELSLSMLGQSSGQNDLQVLREGLCFRPVTRRGPPILARISEGMLGGVKTAGAAAGGIFISAGHGPWGISQSLGTGKVLSEMIQDQTLSASIEGLGI